MTVSPEVVMSESAPAGVAVSHGKPANRLSNQPIALAAAAHAALFIVGSIAMMSETYISVVHRLYLAFLGSGLVAWTGLLVVGLVLLLRRQADVLGRSAARRAAEREDRRVVGQLAAA